MNEFPDIFFSSDGWGESRHVFLAGNNLPDAWQGRDEFVVSELGFGTGLNLLALIALAEDEARAGRPVPRLIYQSVEWEPRPPEAVERLASLWPPLEDPCRALLSVYEPSAGWNQWVWPWGEIVLFVGDARTLPSSKPPFVPADAWFLDGFAPDRGPELWEPALLAWVGTMTRPGGTAATYSAAGVVKQGLRNAGFQVVRAPGWGKKRHMVKARLMGLADGKDLVYHI